MESKTILDALLEKDEKELLSLIVSNQIILFRKINKIEDQLDQLNDNYKQSEMINNNFGEDFDSLVKKSKKILNMLISQ